MGRNTDKGGEEGIRERRKGNRRKGDAIRPPNQIPGYAIPHPSTVHLLIASFHISVLRLIVFYGACLLASVFRHLH